MFDIGFSEMVLVGLVALLVFGPERLPRVAREAALWIRKVRSAVASVKSEIDQELRLQEIRQTLIEKKRSFENQAAEFRTEGEVIVSGKGSKTQDRRDTSGESDHGTE